MARGLTSLSSFGLTHQMVPLLLRASILTAIMAKFSDSTLTHVSRRSWRVFLELFRAKLLESDCRTWGGIIWSLLNPVLTLSLMYAVFAFQFKTRSDSYVLYLLIGIVCINGFLNATAAAIPVFRMHRELIHNTPVPRRVLLGSEVAFFGLKFILELGLCIGVSAFLGLLPGHRLWLLPVTAVSFMAFTWGAALLLSLLFCLVRDTAHFWNLGSRLLFIVTPVFFPMTSLPDGIASAVCWLNPLTPFVMVIRGTLMSSETLQLSLVLHALTLGLVAAIVGNHLFLRAEAHVLEKA